MQTGESGCTTVVVVINDSLTVSIHLESVVIQKSGVVWMGWPLRRWSFVTLVIRDQNNILGYTEGMSYTNFFGRLVSKVSPPSLVVTVYDVSVFICLILLIQTKLLCP